VTAKRLGGAASGPAAGTSGTKLLGRRLPLVVVTAASLQHMRGATVLPMSVRACVERNWPSEWLLRSDTTRDGGVWNSDMVLRPFKRCRARALTICSVTKRRTCSERVKGTCAQRSEARISFLVLVGLNGSAGTKGPFD